MIRKYKVGAPAETAQQLDEFEELKKRLLKMEPAELTAYAAENKIDIGASTSQQGIYKKILAHLEAAKAQ